MKKLNIFSSKRTSLNSQNGDGSPSAPTNTLGRIVNAKEVAQKKWQTEQEEFQKRRREHELKMIEMEQSEVSRREVELRKLGEDLVDIRRKNKMVQDKVKEQMEILQTKLDEYRLEHKAQEESLEDEIQAKEDTIISVKESIEIRMKALDLDCVDTSSVLSDEESKRSLYPTIPAETYKKTSGMWNQKVANCFQKSPVLAHSLDSSRSDTPRTDSSEGDNTSM